MTPSARQEQGAGFICPFRAETKISNRFSVGSGAPKRTPGSQAPPGAVVELLRRWSGDGPATVTQSPVSGIIRTKRKDRSTAEVLRDNFRARTAKPRNVAWFV